MPIPFHKLLAGLFCILLFNCKKPDNPDDPNKKILKSISYQDANFTYSNVFEYDNLGRLSKLSSNRFNLTTVLSYNSSGTLSGAVCTNDHPGNFSYAFEYNSLGQIVKRLKTIASTSATILDRSFAYDPQGRLVGDTLYDPINGQGTRYLVVTYDTKDNIIKRQLFFRQANGIFTSQDYEMITYDDHPNPLFVVGLVYYFTFDDFLLPLSKNNILKQTWPNGTVTISYQYEYGLNNLPKKAIVNCIACRLPFTIEFFYK